MWLVALLISVLAICAYWALSLRYTYWKIRGVPNPPVSILFGNVGKSLCLSKSVGQIYCDIYNEYSKWRYVGFYQIRRPGIILRDPVLIKDVLIQHFANFHDNDVAIDESVDPMGAKNPFLLKGNKWKIVRAQLSPAFTSKRLKSMFPLLESAANKLMDYLLQNLGALEATELSAKYTTEVVANCIFGLEAKSFEGDNSEFRAMGKKIFEASPMNALKFVLIVLIPSLANIFKLGLFSDEVVKYFRNILSKTIQYRKDNNILRSDFLDLLLELKNTCVEYNFTDDDVLAHCLGFFVDGSETSASALSFALYELAINIEAQEKLREAIGSNKLTYEVIQSIPYLDAVLNESLRLHPPGLVISRVCTKEYILPPPCILGISETSSEIKVDIGTTIVIPIYALHYDKTYFEDPKRFNPERFLENRELSTKCTFMPFGDGPRSCHGQRFAVTQVKVGIASIVQKFNIRLNNKTKVPLAIDPAYLILHAKGGIWLEFRRRG